MTPNRVIPANAGNHLPPFEQPTRVFGGRVMDCGSSPQ